MDAREPNPSRDRSGAPWHVLLVAVVSAAYEARFLNMGMNPLDEGWPLYAAMRLQQGGVLYDDVLWVFPPGHVLSAWIGHLLAPPGLFATRVVYALFTVALCVGLYFLARRLMSAPFALLAALLVAVAAPRTHHYHLVFGYRYLVFSVLALLAFDTGLRTGSRRWLVGAGALVGVALVFRLTPAFAVACALGAGVLCTAGFDWRAWWRLVGPLAAGFASVMLPVLLWFALGVGLDTVWREVVQHPLLMLQPLPVPEIAWPQEWGRELLARFFVSLEFRLYPVLFVGYGLALAAIWVREQAAGRPFPHALLLAVVVWGAVYLFRAFGRSDEPHVDSAIPPVCLLLAHLAYRGFDAVALRAPALARRARPAAYGLVAAVLAAWVFLLATDVALFHVPDPAPAAQVRLAARKIQHWTEPGDVVLDLSHAPILYVLAERLGPGRRDIVMPGTFYDAEDEQRFLSRLEASRPKLVVWPLRVFDDMSARKLQAIAPQLVAWLGEHYEMGAYLETRVFLFPRGSLPEDATRPQIRCRGEDCGESFQVPW